ncbi:hypothetical protein LTR29_004463 [Friedmanniomyces endolithicus]|nr:hypothetical protein LTR29_004463 [Friedmanniomyces endolithicus]
MTSTSRVHRLISDLATTSSANQDHTRATRFEQQAYPDMWSLTSVLALLSLLSTYTSATALTYKLVPNEKECFYTHVSNAGAKIVFYFAVSSGGNFDVDYVVYGPAKEPGKERIILEGEKERQGDLVFTANEVGEYRFCFDNTVSTFTDKMVDFEIAVENEARSQIPQRAGASPEQLSGVEETILKLSGQVSILTRQQKYFRTRENRNFSTVRSTEKRIFNFSLMEVIMMVAMACLQVFIVRQFFTGGRKGYV